MNLDKDMERHKFNLQNIMKSFFEEYADDENAVYGIANCSTFLACIEDIRSDNLDLINIESLRADILEYYKVIGLNY